MILLAAGLLLALAGCMTMLASMVVESLGTAEGCLQSGRVLAMIGMGCVLISGLLGGAA